MFPRIQHREDARFGEIREPQVPLRFHVLCADLVDLLEGVEVGDADFGGGQAHNGAILLVERVDVEDALPGYDGALETKMGEARVPWAGEVAGWTC